MFFYLFNKILRVINIRQQTNSICTTVYYMDVKMKCRFNAATVCRLYT